MSTNWGIISAGRISSDFTTALKHLSSDEHKIIAVAARKKADAIQFGKKFDIPNCYEGYDEIMKDTNIDVFYVGAINSSHFDIVMALLKAKRNVLCEKPLGINSEQTKRMVQTAREMKVFLMEAYWSRFFPAYDQLREELKSKTIGDIRIIKAEFGIPIYHKERIIDPKLGGSVVLDLGCYLIQFALLVFNGERPDKITACGSLFDSGVDSQASFTLSYNDGRMAVLTCSGLFKFTNSATIFGTNGSISFPHHFWCPTEIDLPSGHKEFQLNKTKESFKFNFDNSMGLSYEASAVRQALLNGFKEHPLLTLEHSVIISEIMEEIRAKI